MAEEEKPIKPMLVAMKGHPGSGKSTLANALARHLKWPLIDKDDARDCLVLLEGGSPAEGATPAAARVNAVSYEIMWRTAERQLQLGLGVVVDCPLAYVWLFEQGRRVAERCGVAMVIVECVASNAGLWKQRLEGRAAAALGPAAEGAAAAVRSPASDDSEAARRAWAGGIPRLCDLPAAAKWHNYVAWEGLAAKIESYGRCWEYDTGGAAKLVVDTTAGLPLESLLASVLNWLRQIQTPI